LHGFWYYIVRTSHDRIHLGNQQITWPRYHTLVKDPGINAANIKCSVACVLHLSSLEWRPHNFLLQRSFKFHKARSVRYFIDDDKFPVL
jgi:hypothetical protein